MYESYNEKQNKVVNSFYIYIMIQESIQWKPKQKQKMLPIVMDILLNQLFEKVVCWFDNMPTNSIIDID